MTAYAIRVTEGGRIVIPAALRHRLGVGVGDEVMLIVEDDEILMMNREDSVSRARRLVGQFISADRGLVAELNRDRTGGSDDPLRA